MQARELRIGNYVSYQEEKETEIFKVVIISRKMISCENSMETCHLDIEAFKPIPLTEEWLLKFGFRINKNDIRFKYLNSLRLKTTEKGFKFNYGESIKYIKYVHELQNLYFALTGFELELKL